MLSKEICTRCFYEVWKSPSGVRRNMEERREDAPEWCCTVFVGNANYATLNEYNNPPQGCLKLFEQLIYDTQYRGASDVK